MENSFQEYDVVRVTKLTQTRQTSFGYSPEARAPLVGDVGTIVHIYSEADPSIGPFIVKCCDEQGNTLWLEDFWAEELERVD